MKPAIPDDVLRAADDAAGRWSDDMDMTLVEGFARVIMAERERCAKVAESTGNFGDYTRDELTTHYGKPRFDMMQQIITAIRSGA